MRELGVTMQVTKAVIPCGGMGTRFLPITKAVPKEILPIIDTPALAYIVSEAVDSGITDIVIVLGKGKTAIKKYFTPCPALEDTLMAAGKTALWEIVKKTTTMANITFVRQEKPLGSGDAVRKAQRFAGNDPFALAWGDDVIYAETPVIGQLAKAYEQTGTSILGVQKMDTDDIIKYGVVKEGKANGRLHECLAVVEKPPLDQLPGRLASLGRYVLTPEVFAALKKLETGVGGEFQFTDAVDALAKKGRLYAYEFEGRRYDMGDKFGSAQATVEYALRSREFGEQMRLYLKELGKTL